MFLLYNFFVTVTALIWLPVMLIRAARRAEPPNWKERFGQYNLERDKLNRRIWIHAVSVGEVLAVVPILRALRVLSPDHKLFLSVTTSSGHLTAENELAKSPDLYDQLLYFPIDLPRFTLSAIQQTQPEVVAIMETELWFNFLWAAKVFDARTMLINGRISDRSYPRAKLLVFFYNALLAQLDVALMQTDRDTERIRSLGAMEARTVGNCKFDQASEYNESEVNALAESLVLTGKKNPLLVIGSTRGKEEEDFVLSALSALPQSFRENLQVVHAPRHVETAQSLAVRARENGWQVGMRSVDRKAPYLVLDTYGELNSAYRLADVVIIGGGFENLGGQNLIQPLAAGKPVIHGPHMQNFKDAAAGAAAAGSTITVSTPAELTEAIEALLVNAGRRREMGESGREFISAHLGAAQRYASAILDEAERFRTK